MAKLKTTLRIDESIKKAAEAMSVRDGVSLQEIVNNALKSYIGVTQTKTPLSRLLKSKPLGIKNEKLTRKDYYTPDNEIN